MADIDEINLGGIIGKGVGYAAGGLAGFAGGLAKNVVTSGVKSATGKGLGHWAQKGLGLAAGAAKQYDSGLGAKLSGIASTAGRGDWKGAGSNLVKTAFKFAQDRAMNNKVQGTGISREPASAGSKVSPDIMNKINTKFFGKGGDAAKGTGSIGKKPETPTTPVAPVKSTTETIPMAPISPVSASKPSIVNKYRVKGIGNIEGKSAEHALRNIPGVAKHL